MPADSAPDESAPSDAQTRLTGDAFFDAQLCPAPPAGYDDFTDYPGYVLTGSLDGCLYTRVATVKQTPTGVYLETGEEVFIGTLDGGPIGTFATTYMFEGKVRRERGGSARTLPAPHR